MTSYISVAGPTMHTGWMKKISALEEQNRMRQREIVALTERVKVLELRETVLERLKDEPVAVVAGIPVDQVTPIKRGPGRPRKNPLP